MFLVVPSVAMMDRDCVYSVVHLFLLSEVEDPGCIWGRIVKGPGAETDSPQDYENLQVKMNLFYHKVNLDVQKVKPSSLEKGQV